jgi:hypothetical protein
VKVGETREEDRYFRPDRNPVVFKGLRRETVSVPAGNYTAVVVAPTIRTKGMFAEGGEAQVWFSDDERRYPCCSSRSSVASAIKLELQSVTLGDSGSGAFDRCHHRYTLESKGRHQRRKEKTIERIERIGRIAPTSRKNEAATKLKFSNGTPSGRKFMGLPRSFPFFIRLVGRRPSRSLEPSVKSVRSARSIHRSSLMPALGSLMPALQQNDENRV